MHYDTCVGVQGQVRCFENEKFKQWLERRSECVYTTSERGFYV